MVLIYTAWYTTTHDLRWTLSIGLVVSGIFLCYQRATHQNQTISATKTLFYHILIQCICISCVILVVVWYDRSMYDQTISSPHYQWTGIIVWQPKYWQYILQDNQWRLIIIHTSRHWSLGDHIGILWTIKQKPWYTHKTKDTLYTFDYPTRLRMKWYAGVLQVQKERSENKSKKEYNFATLLSIKQSIIDHIEDLFGRSDNGWLIRWVLIWSRAWLTDDTYKLFIGSWLVHLIAVSGSNMVYVAMVLWWLLWRLPYYVRVGVVGIGLIVYAMICWWDSSVIRAVIMSIISIIALYWGRGNSIMYTLPFVVVGMLIFNPYQLVYDLGFILSFGAVIGLIVITQWRKSWIEQYSILEWAHTIQRRMILYPVWSLIIPSIGATLWVLPSLITLTGRYNITWFIVNMILQPCIPLFTLISALGIVINTYQFRVQWIIILTDYIAGSIIWLSKRTVSHWVLITAQWLWTLSIVVFSIVLLWSCISYSSYHRKGK